MYTHADKTQENKRQSVANEVAQRQDRDKSTLPFVNNSPESIAQRKLQEIAQSHSQAKQTTQLQAMAHDCNSRRQQHVQKKENNTGLPSSEPKRKMKGKLAQRQVVIQKQRWAIVPGGMSIDVEATTTEELTSLYNNYYMPNRANPNYKQFGIIVADELKKRRAANEQQAEATGKAEGVEVKHEEIPDVPGSFQSGGITFNLSHKRGEMLLYENDVKSNKAGGAHITIHQPIMNINDWDKDTHEIHARYYISKRASVGVTFVQGRETVSTGATHDQMAMRFVRQLAIDCYNALNG